VALISDVHGNLTALEAVLADIDARGITRIFNLGDYVGKGPRGREVTDICQRRCEVNLLGNWDDFLPNPASWLAPNEELAWWLAQLSPGQAEWLRALPFAHDFVMSGRRVRLYHASSTTVHKRIRFDHDEEEFLSMFANTPATGDGPEPTVVGYGDTHDPYYEVDRAKRTLFNTGSVGNCMSDPTPVYVIMEGLFGSHEEAPFSIQFVRVPYDVEAELAFAREVGMPAWEEYALELRDGIYRGAMGRPEGPRYHRQPRVLAPAA
jgi:diadenosine tetraphosphatase ApaH/serine/threonine PP2A family protein phosphatase